MKQFVDVDNTNLLIHLKQRANKINKRTNIRPLCHQQKVNILFV